jgi:GNAT superfamily N-acetyltransferase
MTVHFEIVEISDHQREMVAQFWMAHWGGTTMVSRGKLYEAREFPGFFAMEGDDIVGLVTYRVEVDECEVMSLDSLKAGACIGSALMAVVKEKAIAMNCRRLWLITTNDNMNAMRFYQKRGFVLVAVHRNALEESRKLKPEIPMVGFDGIPLRDEIELEMMLEA